MMVRSTSQSEASALRRSTRSARSPYLPSKDTIPSATSRYFSSPAVAGDADVDEGGTARATIVKGSSTATKPKPANQPNKRQKKNIVTPTKSASKAKPKRKAKSPPKSLKTTKKPKAKAKTSAATVPVERTRSFEPAWWGNVLTADANSLHSHATSATSSSATPSPASAKGDTPSSAAYPPVHTLILGTHPSIASLDRNEMYGHPLNAFWYLAGDALGFRRSPAVSPTTGKPYVYFHEHLRYDNVLEYPLQLGRMVEKGFALWDIVAECEREGSLDQDIEGEVANPIREFCEGTLNEDANGGSVGVKRIVIANGTTGAKFFVKHFAGWFLDGKLVAADDDMSERVFKGIMNRARKANGAKFDEDLFNGRLIEVVCLPGVSPAAAKFTYLEKREAWERGCYGPGLADYEKWNRAKVEQDIPETPSSQRAKPKSPKKSDPAVRILSSDLELLAPENNWIDLNVRPEELRPSATLTNGQCFNWLVVESQTPEDVSSADGGSSRKQSAWGTHDAKEWVGSLENRVVSIRETTTSTHFRILHGPEAGVREDLRRYFRLETPLAPLYDEWSKADARLAKIAQAIPGVRILRQSPLECMFSFICSSNNNIPRIAKMLSAFRETYGSHMIDIPTHTDGEDDKGSLSLFSFPTLASLADATEEDLRAMGLGYRSKYIVETRNLLIGCGGNEFLLKLRTQQDSQTVQEELIKFSGIGRKVADCVALFSLDQDDAIPVDVHVQHIASRDYDPSVLGEAKSITPTIYKRVGDLFRERFTRYPGWAHSLLFVAELPSFRGVLPPDVVREMDEWKVHEQRKKQEKNEASKKAKSP